MITISIYSGKCDLYDSLIEIGEVTDFSRVHIYINHNPVELRIDSYKDLIPYFPCVPAVETRDNGEYKIWLSGKPWYRIEEEQMLGIYLRDLITCYNRLKRNKNLSLESLVERYDTKYNWNHAKDELVAELASRLIEAKGKKDKVNISDLYLPSGDFFRKRLYEEMVNNGWDENKAYLWCYGWRRWEKKDRDER